MSSPRSFWAQLKEGRGVWGNPSESTIKEGELFIRWCAASVVDLIHELETMHNRIAPGSDWLRETPPA
ncbi:MAG: hypothetical protein M3Q31_13640 [Actinomycetota bacterium]|nr:hypothetical protein [Actinomycetota bacterium]